VALSGCVVVQPPKDSERPRWRVALDMHWAAGCAAGRAFVRKSGNAGIGVAIELRSTRDCRVELTGGRMVWSDGGAVAISPATPIELRGRSLIYEWVPIRFDNDGVWNDDRNRAHLELAYTVDGIAGPPWEVPLLQETP